MTDEQFRERIEWYVPRPGQVFKHIAAAVEKAKEEERRHVVAAIVAQIRAFGSARNDAAYIIADAVEERYHTPPTED